MDRCDGLSDEVGRYYAHGADGAGERGHAAPLLPGMALLLCAVVTRLFGPIQLLPLLLTASYSTLGPSRCTTRCLCRSSLLRDKRRWRWTVAHFSLLGPPALNMCIAPSFFVSQCHDTRVTRTAYQMDTPSFC